MAKQDDFSENDNQKEDNNSDDNFGLPEIEYKPLETKEENAQNSFSEEQGNSVSQESKTSYSYTPEPEPKSSGASLVIALIIGLVVLVAGYLIYQYVIVPQSEKSKKELLAKQEAERLRKEEAARLAKEREEAERAKQQQPVEEVKPAVGTVETLTGKTGRYYVVVASDIDDDLAMDYAKKLSVAGNSIKIIPPFGKSQFFRLAVGDYDTFADAQAKADEAKANFGNNVWVLKY